MVAWLRRFLLRLLAPFSAGRAERELARELESHLALLEDEYRGRGMPPAEARRAAERALGGVGRTREAYREARSFPWLDDARRDARHALRGLARDRGFAVAALMTLAVGIGATTTIFAGVNAVLLRPLPVAEPERLVFAFETGRDGSQRMELTAPDFLDWRRDQSVFSHMAASAPGPATLVIAGEPVRLLGTRVSAEWFRTLGVRPALGRDFTADDDRIGAPRVALVSQALWHGRFGGDPSLVGRALSLDGVSHTVVGVLPPGVGLDADDQRLYVPLALTPAERGSPGARFLTVVARIAPGVTPAAAQAQMAALAARTETLRPGSNRGISVRLDDAREVLVGDLRRPLLLFLCAAMALLLLACANVANLQLVRALARRHELAIRAALGAGRGRLVRQLAMESLVLAVLGGAAGVALAAGSCDLVPWLIPGAAARMTGPLLDVRVLACASVVSLGTGVLFGLTPVWRLTRRDLRARLADRPRGAVGAGHRAGGAFAVAQIALALVLLVGAGLSLHSFARLMAVAPGFQPENLLTFRLSLPQSRYGEPGQRELFHTRLVEALAALPGVTGAGGTSSLPLRGEPLGLSAVIEGRPPVRGPGDTPFFQYRAVTPGYFRTLGIPLLRGRALAPEDGPGRPRVVLVNNAAARRYWPGGDPVGARLKLDDRGDPVEVVGIVADTKQAGLAAETAPTLFLALPQISPSLWRWNEGLFELVVRSATPPASLGPAVRQVVRRLDDRLPVEAIATMDEVIARSVASPRNAMLLMLASGVFALALAALGLYGVMAFLVASRRQEIGVRVALGAARRHVLALVLGQSVRLSLLGLALGVVAALALSRFVTSVLYGVTATDAGTYAAIAGLLFVISLVAAYVPARRALRVDPVIAMRAD
jgi:predicted permease